MSDYLDNNCFTAEAWSRALSAVRDAFEIIEIRKEQEQCMKATACGQDLLAILPHGFSKTLCFMGIPILLSSLFNSGEDGKTPVLPIVIAVSPLTQLILNHVKDYLPFRAVCPYIRWKRQSTSAFGLGVYF